MFLRLQYLEFLLAEMYMRAGYVYIVLLLCIVNDDCYTRIPNDHKSDLPDVDTIRKNIKV